MAFGFGAPVHVPKRPHSSRKICTAPLSAKLDVAVAGGGLGGLALAAALAKSPETNVRIFEATSNYRPFGGPIQVQSNALALLNAIDPEITKNIARDGTPTGDRMSGIKDGLADQWYCKFDTGAPAKRKNLPLTHVIDRPALQTILLDSIGDSNNVTLTTGTKVVSYEHEQGADGPVTITLQDGTVAKADVLIGADGIWSNVRAQMHKLPENAKKTDSASYSGYICYTATCKASPEDIKTMAYKIYLGKKQYFVCSDVGQGRMQWYAFLGQPPSQSAEEDPVSQLGLLREKFDGWSPEVLDLLNATEEDAVAKRDLYDRAPLVKEGWLDGHVALMGDAAHPMMPNLGQGGCMAFEDAYVLSRELMRAASGETELRSALSNYESRRMMRAGAVHGLARLSSDLLFHYDRLATGGIEAMLGWGVFWSTVGSVAVGQSMPLMLEFLYVNLLEEGDQHTLESLQASGQILESSRTEAAVREAVSV